MLRHLSLFLLLARMQIRSQLEQRNSFTLARVAQFLTYLAIFLMHWILVNKFQTLGGWTWPQLALLYSFQLLSYSLGAALGFVQFRELEDLVRLGTLDAILVKPVNLWSYIVFSGLSLTYVGHIVLAAMIIIWTLFFYGPTLELWSLFFLLGSLISSTILILSIMTIIGAASFMMIKSSHFFVTLFGFLELSRYPLNIFPTCIQVVLLSIMPLAFSGFVPVAVFLKLPVPFLGSWAGFFALAAGPIFACVASVYWRFALKRYKSGGG